jgi:molecular chaperone DnaJ
MTGSAMRPSMAAWAAGAPGGGGFGGQGDFASAFSDVFDDLFGDFMGGQQRRRAPRAARGSDLRYNLRVTLEEAYSVCRKRSTCPPPWPARPATAPAPKAAPNRQTCPTCSGMGKVRAQQGFFTVERTCPTCSGLGQIIKNPCKTCGGAGRVEKDRALSVNIPAGVETGTRIRLAGEGEAGCAAVRRAISTSSSKWRRSTTSSSATASTSTAACPCR